MKNSVQTVGLLHKAAPYFTASLLSAFVLTGCSVPDHYPDLATMWEANELSSTNTFSHQAEMDWPSANWWQRYQDAQLNHLIEEALQHSPSLEMAMARLKGAQGFARQAGAIRSFDLGLAASATESKVSERYQSATPPDGWNDYGTLTLNFQYDFDFWGKNRAAVVAATSELAAAEAESVAARLMISTSIANAYAELARLYANQETVHAALQVRNKTVELLEKRYANGLETLGSVSQAKAVAASVEAELLGIQESIQLQKNALAALVGQGPDRAASIEEPHITLTSRYGLPSEAGVGLLGIVLISPLRVGGQKPQHSKSVLRKLNSIQMSLCQRLLVIRHLVWIICLIVVMTQVQLGLRSTYTIYGWTFRGAVDFGRSSLPRSGRSIQWHVSASLV